MIIYALMGAFLDSVPPVLNMGSFGASNAKKFLETSMNTTNLHSMIIDFGDYKSYSLYNTKKFKTFTQFLQFQRIQRDKLQIYA
jgi:hypothetical protein